MWVLCVVIVVACVVITEALREHQHDTAMAAQEETMVLLAALENRRPMALHDEGADERLRCEVRLRKDIARRAEAATPAGVARRAAILAQKEREDAQKQREEEARRAWRARFR